MIVEHEVALCTAADYKIRGCKNNWTLELPATNFQIIGSISFVSLRELAINFPDLDPQELDDEAEKNPGLNLRDRRISHTSKKCCLQDDYTSAIDDALSYGQKLNDTVMQTKMNLRMGRCLKLKKKPVTYSMWSNIGIFEAWEWWCPEVAFLFLQFFIDSNSHQRKLRGFWHWQKNDS